MAGAVGEGVDGDDEGDAAFLQAAHDVEADFEAAGVHEDHRAEGAFEQTVPEEPEALLAGGAEEVEHQLLGDADAAEVHGHGGGRLGLGAVVVVDPMLAWVMVSSVVSGLISLTEPTMVVLPTPKPPTMTIFTAAWAGAGGGPRFVDRGWCQSL
ncbi:hypothetical protein SBADM41S_11584 [Streptomyces badius]